MSNCSFLWFASSRCLINRSLSGIEGVPFIMSDTSSLYRFIKSYSDSSYLGAIWSIAYYFNFPRILVILGIAPVTPESALTFF
jgi:hypothetical protein